MRDPACRSFLRLPSPFSSSLPHFMRLFSASATRQPRRRFALSATRPRSIQTSGRDISAGFARALHLAVASCPLGYPPAEPLPDLQGPSDFLLRLGWPRCVAAQHQRPARPHGAPEARGKMHPRSAGSFGGAPRVAGWRGHGSRNTSAGASSRECFLAQGSCMGIPAGAARETAGSEMPRRGLHRLRERWTSFSSRRCNARRPFNDRREHLAESMRAGSYQGVAARWSTTASRPCLASGGAHQVAGASRLGAGDRRVARGARAPREMVCRAVPRAYAGLQALGGRAS